jgi:predicted Co/Zn/Cd cation transporter (cation efflux family)
MMFHSTTIEIGRGVFRACAKVGRDDTRVPVGRSDLTPIFLLIAGGLLLTALFFSLGFGPETSRMLAASG